MSALWTSAEIAAATRGRAGGIWAASGVSIDSRTVARDDLFVALQGPNFDGHGYVAKALEAGAAGALVHKRPENLSPSLDHRLITVKDTFTGLNDLGRAGRARSHAKVAGVTGSVGKTGTKDMLKTVLAAQAPTHATLGNLNNHWGVPLTLSRMPHDARYAVIEMGMNHPGEIAPLSVLSRPHVAIVTWVAAAHLEFFESVAGIATEKASIAAGLEPGGVLVLPDDNAERDTLIAVGKKYDAGSIVTFGARESADVRMIDVALTTTGSQVVAEIAGARIRYDLGVPGRHSALNSLAVLAAARALGADVGRAAAEMGKVVPTSGRGDRHKIVLPRGSFEVIDESYNASPASVRALAELLAAIKPGAGGRRIMVLGDMRELGARGGDLHAELGGALEALRLDLVFTAGPLMERLHLALPQAMRGGHAADSLALVSMVANAVAAGDIVAVKGSHGSNMKPIVDALVALGKGAPARAANGH